MGKVIVDIMDLVETLSHIALLLTNALLNILNNKKMTISLFIFQNTV